ncbi:branched-chain amino acid ABC transporter permease [Paenibacillus validus]|uniref:Branched-chain amino acid ABC transporter permease n=2 Tax=Paenibacillus validus TaxID=44253 RepID=A0A7X3CQW9_9BACL|nr:branched-chain amino acid ABC transporter permease [Paenibacillus validus]MED4601900.1 branched-chain amino acid ABC transporter permease [Paenibacillus validus]MED4606418.1 branched-chain amino acid ABC transporter permease [Paenibacillus validus]MUG70060.1 branched-chain amino acid ABC transporter permease [Paenibacillus validus]
MLQLIVSGLIFGCIYGLAALGIVLIFKTTDIANFAQGEMAMITTFVSFMFLTKLELPYLISFILALVFAGIFGTVVHRIFMKPIQSAPPLNQIVLTLGLFLAFNGVAGLIWGHTPAPYPPAFAGDPYDLGGVFISMNEVFVIGVTVILMLGFFLLFRFTAIGLAMRASSQDSMASELMGIKVSSVFTWTWGVGTVLGGVAGMLTAPFTFLQPSMMADVLIMGFAAAVLGGFISLPGAVIGGLIIGVFGNLISFYVSPEMKLVYTFLLIIVVLYIRPTGLFGGNQYLKKV